MHKKVPFLCSVSHSLSHSFSLAHSCEGLNGRMIISHSIKNICDMEFFYLCLMIFGDISIFDSNTQQQHQQNEMIWYFIIQIEKDRLSIQFDLIGKFKKHNSFILVDQRSNFIWGSYQIEKNSVAHVQCLYAVRCVHCIYAPVEISIGIFPRIALSNIEINWSIVYLKRKRA